MKRLLLLVLALLFIISVAFVAYLKRYQLAAKLWHLRYGQSITVGNYELPVPDRWLVTDHSYTAVTLMNTTPNFFTDSKFHMTRSVITVFPFRDRTIGNEQVNFWLSFQRQWLEREGLKSIEEKKLNIQDAEVACIGGTELKDVIVAQRHPSFDSDIVSLDCKSTDDLDVLFVGEPSDVQSFYAFVAQIRRIRARTN